ncbi:class I SAM-dependent methyltransferase [Roseateles sp.]|uniref:class I SAM-dependent methyltransferase n=1 Tax=Roseateles sp. TaxID=1971397 RepID=UPI0032656C8E
MTTSIRVDPPFWRHDAYTLRRLAEGVISAIPEVLPAPTSTAACVVDMGAGDAPYRSLFEARGARYVACDIDAPEGGETLRIDIGRPLPLAAGCAQVVVSFQVLEHVWDLDWYLGEARRLLAPEGHLLLSTHGIWLYHPHPTDFRRWTRAGLIAELEQRGFEIRSVRALVGPLAWTTQFRALGWNRLLQALPFVGPWVAGLSNALHHLRMRLEDALTPRDWAEDNAAVYLVVATPRRAAPTSALMTAAS